MTIKKITRAIVLTALFLIPLFSLIVADTYFFPFITGKAFISASWSKSPLPVGSSFAP